MKVDFCKEEMILKVYPTIEGCFHEAWGVLKNHFLVLFLAVILGGLIEMPMGYKQYFELVEDGYTFGFSSLGMFGLAYYMLIATPFNYGINWMFL